MGAMSQEKSEAAPEIPVVLCAWSLKKAWERGLSRYRRDHASIFH